MLSFLGAFREVARRGLDVALGLLPLCEAARVLVLLGLVQLLEASSVDAPSVPSAGTLSVAALQPMCW